MNPKNSNNFDTQLTNLSFNWLTTILFYFSILFFIIGFNFSDVMVGNWYQQFMPNLNGANIVNVQFTDSLTGYAVTNLASGTSYILKTSNAGDNWSIIFTHNQTFSKVAFINSNTGFVDYFLNGNANLLKTTNGGTNWTTIYVSQGFVNDISILNVDTIWVTNPMDLVGGLYWTPNGGASWQRIYWGTALNPEKIYMVNSRIGFMSRPNSPFNKTTDGGYNWAILSGGGWTDIYFMDTLKGWKANIDIKKTTDGGLSWVTQTLPFGGMIEASQMLSFSNINKDTVWGNGGAIRYPNNQLRLFLVRTVNGGSNWLFQVPDTSIRGDWAYVNFADKYKGWATSLNVSFYPADEIHTTVGGDTTFLLGVHLVNNEIPKQFKLLQNYPNPFNASSKIKYQLSKNNVQVKISVFDIAGREIIVLVNQQQNAGTYEFDFEGTIYSSGVYFYRLTVSIGKEVFTETRKMILIK